MSETANPVGRPRTIDSPETFDRLVAEYMSMCQDPEKPKAITLTGMILHLGLSSREALDNYLTYPEFFDSVKRAKLLVEHEYENRLIVGTNAASPIFALKNFGWKDKSEVALANPEGEVFKTVSMTAEEAYKQLLSADEGR